jgi:hypothetical protein
MEERNSLGLHVLMDVMIEWASGGVNEKRMARPNVGIGKVRQDDFQLHDLPAAMT